MDYLSELYWKLKHPINNIKGYIRIKSFPPGTLVEDCNFHPCVVIKNYGEGTIDVISLASYKPNSCSLFHCGIVKLTQEELNERIKIYNDKGDKGLAMLCGWTEESYEAFEKEWR